jgi:acid phosphatase
MHSGSIADADAWLRQHMDAYAQWARTHNSLLIVTWDEDDGSDANHIPTLFVGAHVQPGKYAETINHFDVLRTIEALEGVSFTNEAAHATTIADVWQS